MLNAEKEECVARTNQASLRGPSVTAKSVEKAVAGSRPIQARLARVLRIEWIGQTVASLCWIGSVLAYGISSSGDWLQLLAASSWLVANIAAAVTIKAE
ncbi:MAG: hypothetical protein VX970_08375 [Planctomycetota bacterium]|nr:hypothetical protein [Planctomycetota bacterium]